MRVDYVVVRHDNRTLEFDLTNDDDAPLNLVGATVNFIVDDLFTRAVDVDESSGEAALKLEYDDTDGAPDCRRSYRYEVQVTEADGDRFTPQRGRFTVLPDLTADT